jgi:hypothetical protein
LLSGALALCFGLNASTVVARVFCIVLGALYGLLGLAGFVAGGQEYSLTIIPGSLVLGAMNHLAHLVLGVIFLSVGWSWQPALVTLSIR